MLFRRRAVRVTEALQEAGAVVAVEIMSAQTGYGGAVVDEASGNRAALSMLVFEHRQLQSRLVARTRVVAMRPLHDHPAVVHAGGAGGNDVHFLPRVLSDVCDIEASRLA